MSCLLLILYALHLKIHIFFYSKLIFYIFLSVSTALDSWNNFLQALPLWLFKIHFCINRVITITLKISSRLFTKLITRPPGKSYAQSIKKKLSLPPSSNSFISPRDTSKKKTAFELSWISASLIKAPVWKIISSLALLWLLLFAALIITILVLVVAYECAGERVSTRRRSRYQAASRRAAREWVSHFSLLGRARGKCLITRRLSFSFSDFFFPPLAASGVHWQHYKPYLREERKKKKKFRPRTMNPRILVNRCFRLPWPWIDTEDVLFYWVLLRLSKFWGNRWSNLG